MENKQTNTTRNSKDIKASPETLFRAFTDPGSLEAWLAPGEMTGKVHNFDLRWGGGYTMSLFYPVSEKKSMGKTTTTMGAWLCVASFILGFQSLVAIWATLLSGILIVGFSLVKGTIKRKLRRRMACFI